MTSLPSATTQAAAIVPSRTPSLRSPRTIGFVAPRWNSARIRLAIPCRQLMMASELQSVESASAAVLGCHRSPILPCPATPNSSRRSPCHPRSWCDRRRRRSSRSSCERSTPGRGSRPLSCPDCRSPLNLIQPDENEPTRLLGTCESCSKWAFLVELEPDWKKVLLIELPDGGSRLGTGDGWYHESSSAAPGA